MLLRATLIAASVAMIIAVLLPVGAAYADSADDHYLALLSSHGITGHPADQLIADGHQTCDAYSQGGFGIGISPRQVAMIKLNNDFAGQGFSPHDMSQLILDATRAYCPEYAPPQ
jgi:hypothetical protein